MLFKKTITKEILVIIFILCILSIGEIYLSFFDSANIPSIVQTINRYSKKVRFIFPKSFDEERFSEFKYKVSGSTYYRFNGSQFPDSIFKTAKEEDFHQHDISVYHSNLNIKEDNKKCPELHRETTGIFVDEAKVIDLDMIKVMRNFMKDLPNNEYYQEIAPFFIDHLEDQFANGDELQIPEYWFQLAGSSVWLEEYGVHFMIRRVIYCPTAKRNAPSISLTYAQIFDENWNELEDTSLVIPDDTGMSDHDFVKFPKFLPVPFYHDVDTLNNRYYGPEDPRITKYKNKFGHYEPLIIFNAYHRKFEKFDDDEDHTNNIEAKFYRSMWVCFPFKFQRGKFNTDGNIDEMYGKMVYSKIEELRIKDRPRQEKQKNWTPFLSYNEQVQNREDIFNRYLYFIYRWANLEVLRCDVVSGVCDFEYKLYPSLLPSTPVGELRGGTALLSINELMVKLGIDIKYYLPPEREVWLGFARAHIDNCGCGPVMYRPNLVLVVKDKIRKKDSESEFDVVYKISHVSSSISFDINVFGWNLNQPHMVCLGNNILIPNGISSWVINQDADTNDKIVDYLTLTVSVSDYDVERINIRNLLAEVVQFEGVFLGGDKMPYIPQSTKPSQEIGYNNDNVECAISTSKDFCKVYGLEHPGSH